LADSLTKYKTELTDAEASRNKEYGSLDRLLKTVLESNQQLRGETANLVNALKRPTVRGRWGEIQLKRIVELSGLSAHCDFQEQVSVDSDEGRLRPDMIIHLPNGRDIVVDSKAILAGYLEAESATDDNSRKTALGRHAASLRTRIQELSRKNYWEQFASAPEFVVLFIPGEAFFSAALEHSPDLVEAGFEQRVIIATPTTLMALLRAVAYGWRQEQLAENAKRISEQAARVYQGLAVWTDHLATLGSSLDRASKAYNSAVGSLERTVLPPARRLKDFGVSTKDEIKELNSLETALRSLNALPPEEPGGNA
jgi:DNA recombination protein RmuC